jgi:UPF0755 protein
VRQREHESPTSESGDLDPRSLLFGDDEDDADLPLPRASWADRRRSEHAHRLRLHRRGRLFVVLAALIVAAVGWLVVPRVVAYFRVPDYAGAGAGKPSVTVVVHPGDTAADIASTLQKSGIVKSTAAFTDAASDNARSTSIQPGSYLLHEHMSGKAALAALLAAGSRLTSSDLVVREGATSLDVAAEMVKACGADPGAVATALQKPADLGIPVTYKVGSQVPASAEGFLYPATYTPESCRNPGGVLQRMVSRFISQDRDTGFATDAATLGLTPYQALIVASIAQSEAKFAEDMPKVVRTILNRVKVNRPLQFDSTSSYACKLKHQAHCIYDQIAGPYNTYLNKGLPPTPIDNPGAASMKAAVHPAAGNWLFFVNSDKAGHLFFTNDERAFARAAARCRQNNWGCG